MFNTDACRLQEQGREKHPGFRGGGSSTRVGILRKTASDKLGRWGEERLKILN